MANAIPLIQHEFLTLKGINCIQQSKSNFASWHIFRYFNVHHFMKRKSFYEYVKSTFIFPRESTDKEYEIPSLQFQILGS